MQIIDTSMIVDEYLPQPLYGVPVAVSQFELQPQFQRIPERIEYIIVTGPATGNAQSVQTGPGQITSPTANQVIASIPAASLVAVTYAVQWQVELDGTVSATDIDNFKLLLGSTGLETSTNDGVVGKYTQEPVTVTVPAGNVGPLKVQAIGAGTVGAVYSAQISAQPVSYTFSLQLGDRYWSNLALPPTGVLTISTKALILNPSDRRIFTAQYAGQWNLELIGYADARNPL